MKSSATVIHINVCNFEETLGHCREREYFNYIGSPGICAKSHPTGIEPVGKHRDGGLDLSLLKVCLSIYIDSQTLSPSFPWKPSSNRTHT